MAKAGFTGAPALTLQTEHWKDLGQDWLVEQQYFKPYPVCRWAQAPIEAVLDLKSRHKFTSKNVASIHITSFHEAVRLGQKTATNTEEAQYSTSFPCAVALVHGTVLPEHVADDALKDSEVQRLSSVLTMDESDHANSVFPNSRLARADITLTNGQLLESSWFEPTWDAKAPPTRTELTTKFQNYATPVLGASRTQAIYDAVLELDKTDTQNLFGLLAAPIRKAGTHVS